MRVDEKQVDGPDLERQEEQEETLLNEQREEAELPEMAGDEVRDVAQDRNRQLLTAMQMIVDKKHLNVTHLRLPQRETMALEALQAAVHGRTTNLDQFVFASDRRSLLEQALAVLQPNIGAAAQQQVAAMSDELRNLTKHVGELRESLMNLEDGQDDLMSEGIYKGLRELAKPGDTADKPAPSDPDAPRPPSTLAKGGPEAKHEEKTTSLTTGPEAKREETATTLLGGPEVKRAETVTTLGDPAEIAAEAKSKPWWRNG